MMVGMVPTFAVMSGAVHAALALGPSANAIFLADTAPILGLICVAVFVVEEQRADLRGLSGRFARGLGHS